MTPAITEKALARQIERHRGTWPDDLLRKAGFALNALHKTDERSATAVQLRTRDLRAFVGGYAQWVAGVS